MIPNTFKNVSLVLVMLVACVLSLAGSPSPALALVTCSPLPSTAVDTDGDGFSDAAECGGILFDGVTYTACGSPRELCMDPNTKDVFIYVVQAAGSLLTTDATGPGNLTLTTVLFRDLVEPRTSAGTGKVAGLGLGVHVSFRSTAPPDRNVPSGATATLQQAIVVTESLEPQLKYGASDVGTPSATGEGTVFTQQIKNDVNRLMGSESPSQYKTYFQYVFTHEVGHVMALRAMDDATIDHHYSTKSLVLMSESVTFASRTKTFTFPTAVSAGDNPCLLLVDTANPLNCIAFPPIILF